MDRHRVEGAGGRHHELGAAFRAAGIGHEFEVDHALGRDGEPGGERRGGIRRLAVGDGQHEARTPARGGSRHGEGDRARLDRREVGGAHGARERRDLEAGAVEEEEARLPRRRREGVADLVGGVRQLRADLDAVQARPPQAQGERDGLIVEHLAAGIGQRHAGGVAAVDVDDDLGARIEPGGVAAGQVQHHLAVIRRHEIGGKAQLDPGAQQAPVELTARDAETRQFEPLAALHLVAPDQGRERGAGPASAGIAGCGELGDRRPHVLRAGSGHGERRGAVAPRRQQREPRPGDRSEILDAVGAADLGGGPHEQVDAAAAGQRRPEAHRGPGEPAHDGHGLHGTDHPLQARQGRLLVEEHAHGQRPALVGLQGGQRFQVQIGRRRDHEPGSGGIDLGPQLVGRVDRAIDAVALARGEGDRVVAGLEDAVGDREFHDLDGAGRLDAGPADLGAVHEAGEFRALRRHRDRREVGDAQPCPAPDLPLGEIDGVLQHVLLAGEAEAARARGQAPGRGDRRLHLTAAGGVRRLRGRTARRRRRLRRGLGRRRVRLAQGIAGRGHRQAFGRTGPEEALRAGARTRARETRRDRAGEREGGRTGDPVPRSGAASWGEPHRHPRHAVPASRPDRPPSARSFS